MSGQIHSRDQGSAPETVSFQIIIRPFTHSKLVYTRVFILILFLLLLITSQCEIPKFLVDLEKKSTWGNLEIYQNFEKLLIPIFISYELLFLRICS